MDLTNITGSPEISNAEYDWHKVTVRAKGKSHRGLATSDGHLEYITCSCPGSKNGSLRNQATIISNGWNVANCGN